MAGITIHDYRNVGAISSPMTGDPQPQDIFLEGEPLKRFNQFFENREYQYGNQTFSLIRAFRQCVNRLERSGISVTGVFLKGGAVHKFFMGSQRQLADLDVVIEIAQPRDWKKVEGAIFNGDWAVFLDPEARKNRVLVRETTKEFALYTLCTSHQGRQEYIDLQVLVESPNSCFCSCDSIQINMMSLIQGTGGRIRLRAVGGYDLKRSIALLLEHKFYADLKAIETLRDGLRGYCHMLTRGEYPEDWTIEQEFWRTFIAEYQAPQFAAFASHLKKYLEDHYSQDPQGKIFYLLNYCAIFLRCAADPVIKTQLFEILYDAENLPCPAEPQEELEVIQAYFYIQTQETIFEDRSRRRAFVAVDEDHFLVLPIHDLPAFRDRVGGFYPLFQKIGGDSTVLKQCIDQEIQRREVARKKRADLERNPLLEFLQLDTTAPKDAADAWLAAFNNPRVSLSKLDPHQAFDLGEATEKLVVALFSLKNPEVQLAQKIFEEVLQQKDLPQRSNILKTAFSLFCSHSHKTARVLYRKLDRENHLEYLQIFARQEETKKLFEWIQFTLENKKLTLEQCLDLLCETVKKNSSLLAPAWAWIKTGEPEVQRSYFARLFRDLDRRSSLFPYCQELYKQLGVSLLLDPEIALFYLQELTVRDRRGAIELYLHIESEVPNALELYPIIAEAVCGLGAEEWAPLLCRGLERIVKKSDLDERDIKILDIFARYQRRVFKIPVIKEKFQQMEERVRAFSTGLYKEKERIIAAVRWCKKPAPSAPTVVCSPIIEEKKQVEAPPSVMQPQMSSLFTISSDEVAQISAVALSFKQYSSGNKLEAMKTLQDAIKTYPNSLKLRIQLVSIYQKELDQIDEVIKTQGESFILTAQAIAYLKKVARLYVECAKIQPDFVDWPMKYGFICYQLGEPKKAQDAFQRAFKMNPDDEYIQMALAGCHWMQGHADLAVEIMKEAIASLEKKQTGPKALIEAHLGLAKYYLTSSTPEKSAGEYEFVFRFKEFRRDRKILLEEYPQALFARGNHAITRSILEPDQAKSALQRAIIDFQTVIDTVPCDSPYYTSACFSSKKAADALEKLPSS